jgi:hypothetical protein
MTPIRLFQLSGISGELLRMGLCPVVTRGGLNRRRGNNPQDAPAIRRLFIYPICHVSPYNLMAALPDAIGSQSKWAFAKIAATEKGRSGFPVAASFS